MSVYWAYCRTCDRSFYIAPAVDGLEPADVSCPVCLGAPDEIHVEKQAPAR